MRHVGCEGCILWCPIIWPSVSCILHLFPGTMKVLAILTGLLLSCDAWSNNNDLNTRPQSAQIYYVLPQINQRERLIAGQQVLRQQTPVLSIMRARLSQPPTRFQSFSAVQVHSQHSGESSEIREQPLIRQRVPTTYPSFTTTTGQTNTHNTNHHHGTISGFSQTQRPTVVNHGVPGYNLQSSTSITSPASKTPVFSDSFGSQNTGTYQPTLRPQTPTTPQTAHKPSVVQGHKDSITSQSQKPSSVGHEGNIHTANRQDGKPSSVDPQASQRNPACYHTPDLGTCRAALPR